MSFCVLSILTQVVHFHCFKQALCTHILKEIQIKIFDQLNFIEHVNETVKLFRFRQLLTDCDVLA